MTPTRERIEAHLETGVAWCNEADFHAIATLALEADTYRLALEQVLVATHHAFTTPSAGNGDAQAMIAAYEKARAALGGTS